jgi:hypothetical protein
MRQSIQLLVALPKQTYGGMRCYFSSAACVSNCFRANSDVYATDIADIDSDSFMNKPVSEIILPDDELVVGFELRNFDIDWCYNDHFRLSHIAQARKYPDMLSSYDRKIHAARDESKRIFNDRILLNWCLTIQNPETHLGGRR